MSFGVLFGVSACVAIAAVYFLWVRKLGNKSPEQAATATAKGRDA
jgi:hypothetical protein